MKKCFFLLICTFLIACDPYHPPIVANAYDEPIEVSIAFKNSSPPQTGMLIEPGSALIQHKKHLEITEIRVKEVTGRLHVYGTADFDALLSKRKVDFEVWILSPEGLKLGDKAYLHQFLRRKNKGGSHF